MTESLHIAGTETVDDLRLHHLRTRTDALLDVAALRVVLSRFLAGELSADELERIAEFYELAEWVMAKPGEGDMVNEAVFLLANPGINLPNTPEKVREILAGLGG